MAREERYDEEEVVAEDRFEPAATDEETARAVERAEESERTSEQASREAVLTDARPWAAQDEADEPDVDAEAAEGDVVEQSQPWGP